MASFRLPLTAACALLALLSNCGAKSLPPCELQGTEPAWLTEAQELQMQLGCRGPVSLQERVVQLVGLPEGAQYQTETGLLSWTPGLHQAAVYDVGLQLPETGEGTTLRIAVADAILDPANQPVLDPSTYTEEFGIPVLTLDSLPAEAEYAAAGITFRGRRYEGEAKLRGSSSLNYPKRNYTLRFDGDDRFHAPELGSGFPLRKKMVLTSTFDDNSYVRSRASALICGTS